MPSAIFHCKYCGKKYRTTKESILNSSHCLKCNNCGKETKVGFFDCCPKCHENVDFYVKGSLDVGVPEYTSIVGNKVMQMFTNPLGLVTDTINDINSQDSNGVGFCPICDTRYVRCSSCNELTEIPSTTKLTEKVHCVHCGQILFPSALQVGKGANHSLEYYKVGM